MLRGGIDIAPSMRSFAHSESLGTPKRSILLLNRNRAGDLSIDNFIQLQSNVIANYTIRSSDGLMVDCGGIVRQVRSPVDGEETTSVVDYGCWDRHSDSGIGSGIK